MTTKEELIKEIAQAPDFLIAEVLNLLLFIKNRFKQKNSENPTEMLPIIYHDQTCRGGVSPPSISY
ncbi:hypothetical protein ACOWPH_08830 [Anabaena sp. PCC 7938]|uniref:DUF2281 domain-containing protein n=1 Tax=Anabaena cylindrica (strain ATCC 27899 / PCC 7122) TaxID=272123 RepID=K9ZI07_ANACC|nr:hypothetical protein [Anabaena sp. CCAP 1446/1C]AFZ58394.1 hypothetical protein Anacy_2974 [Anabaena cylindrica PCC 7122]MBY5280206.1 hypothetical protein [Anabaena sp. CCAP 1446/1C]MCM2406527.1 hypothetical protein [Anabaena sp. CCAP 1446/1C]BAY04616.1 hypothetical protein NIES19_38810 [Anabaena cylindrica PCC 7122]